MTPENTIQDVSDTALWVAHFRALESARPDRLFNDPYAKLLAGDRGPKFAESMKDTARYTQWSLVTRTLIIDRYIRDLLKEGVDAVINLGAGLDTRPYRMQLADSLHWVEVDYPHLLEYKTKLLQKETPTVRLERIALDLADRGARRELFARLGARFNKCLIITEGVLPYLSEEQAATLAEDLHVQNTFQYWIGEYMAPEVYRYLHTKKRKRQMKNAPFLFFPADWFGFFKRYGWKPAVVRYLYDESIEAGRPIPMPWWASVLSLLFSKKLKDKMRRNMGYVVFER